MEINNQQIAIFLLLVILLMSNIGWVVYVAITYRSILDGGISAVRECERTLSRDQQCEMVIKAIVKKPYSAEK